MSDRFIYFLRQVTDEGPVKIGISKSPLARLEKYLKWSPVDLKILECFPGTGEDEIAIHDHLIKHRLRGEWFHPHLEVFTVMWALKSGALSALDLPAKGKSRSTAKRIGKWRGLSARLTHTLNDCEFVPQAPAICKYLQTPFDERRFYRTDSLADAIIDFCRDPKAFGFPKALNQKHIESFGPFTPNDCKEDFLARDFQITKAAA